MWGKCGMWCGVGFFENVGCGMWCGVFENSHLYCGNEVFHLAGPSLMEDFARQKNLKSTTFKMEGLQSNEGSNALHYHYTQTN